MCLSEFPSFCYVYLRLRQCCRVVAAIASVAVVCVWLLPVLAVFVVASVAVLMHVSFSHRSLQSS